MSYNKSERHTQEPKEQAGYKTINASSLGYIGLVIKSGLLFYFLLYTLCLFSDGKGAAYFTLFIAIICLYISLRSYFVDIKGKLYYNDTQLHYEGYTFDFFPRKHIVDIPWNEVTSAWVYSQEVLRGAERDILQIKKSDNSRITLNICYFFDNKITIDLIHKYLLASCKANPTDNPEEYQITIHNYTSPFSFITNYLQLEIFTNEDSRKTREKQITLNVKTGDLLALKCGFGLQLIRLKDPSLTEFYVDNLSKDFDLIIRKAKVKENTEY